MSRCCYRHWGINENALQNETANLAHDAGFSEINKNDIGELLESYAVLLPNEDLASMKLCDSNGDDVIEKISSVASKESEHVDKELHEVNRKIDEVLKYFVTTIQIKTVLVKWNAKWMM